MQPQEINFVKAALKHLDEKNYRKALKVCGQGLCEYPNQAELVCIKGSCVYQQGSAHDGLSMVKAGIALNPRSGLCWHLYSIALKSGRQYKEALKCVLNALKFDDHNPSLSRDLLLLYLQEQDFEGSYGVSSTLFYASSFIWFHLMSLAASAFLSGRINVTLVLLAHLHRHLDTHSIYSTLLWQSFKLSILECRLIFMETSVTTIMSSFNDCNYEKVLPLVQDSSDRYFQILKAVCHIRLCASNCIEDENATNALASLYFVPAPDVVGKLKQLQCFSVLHEIALSNFYVKCTPMVSFMDILSLYEEAMTDIYEFHAYCLRRPYITQYLQIFTLSLSLLENPTFVSSLEFYLRSCLSANSKPNLSPFLKYCLSQVHASLLKVYLYVALLEHLNGNKYGKAYFISKCRHVGYLNSIPLLEEGCQKFSLKMGDHGFLFEIIPYLDDASFNHLLDNCAFSLLASFAHTLSTSRHVTISHLKSNREVYAKLRIFDGFAY
jgi:tetratricopeptide (TPR) repeat protein